VVLIDDLGFQGRKKSFLLPRYPSNQHAGRMLLTMPWSARSRCTMAGVLTTAVGVVQQTTPRPPVRQGHFQSVHGELAIDALAHRPADNPA
jgi:hypothetical protein